MYLSVTLLGTNISHPKALLRVYWEYTQTNKQIKHHLNMYFLLKLGISQCHYTNKKQIKLLWGTSQILIVWALRARASCPCKITSGAVALASGFSAACPKRRPVQDRWKISGRKSRINERLRFLFTFANWKKHWHNKKPNRKQHCETIKLTSAAKLANTLANEWQAWFLDI